MNLKAVKPIKIEKNIKASELVSRMKETGFNAKFLAESVDILEEAIKDKECKIFFGLAGAMVPAGMKQILIEMVEKGYIDVFVSTGANLTHDLIEALGFNHYQG